MKHFGIKAVAFVALAMAAWWLADWQGWLCFILGSLAGDVCMPVSLRSAE